jgi:exopolysaccharide production protein ExoF
MTVFLPAALLAAAISAPAGAQTAEPYRVMSGDTLRVDVFLSPEHSADARVNDAGEISLPAIGRVRAAGLTTAEIEASVIDELAKLSEIPSVRVVVSVSEYRPLFILGFVNSPGKYPYAARTTVLQALALAGGVGNPLMRRSSQDDPGDVADRQERYEVAALSYLAALARRTRLLAEQKGAETLEFPADLVSKLTAAGKQDVIDRERDIFVSRRQTFANSLAVIESQKKVSQDEIASARIYSEQLARTAPAMQKELDNLTTLRDRGLTRRLEVLTVQEQVNDMQREIRQSELTITRAQRDLNNLDKEAANLVSQRATDIAQALVETEAEIVSYKTRLENQGKLVAAGGSAAAGLVQDPSQTPVEYEIVRLDDKGNAATIAADENTILHPGDVLKVIGRPQTLPAVSN